ncbi:nitrite reductase small subunit NirD [uncultured Nocardioides sp.]|uniref:nitrite reductase small subunit NirD n=1 Tax=uncultured Nocardioides sp. TaxID=198441 RepID=UPI00260492E9|nr:nitrite reductase small subunit NirD [uncultured Nocardioides sp.]
MTEWQPVCRLEDLHLGCGAVALAHGQALALFRTSADEVYAVGNHDPFDHAATMNRGVVGVRDGVPFVGSPRHGHAFDLRTGRCLDDDHAAVPAYPVQVVDGVVHVGRRRVDAA